MVTAGTPQSTVPVNVSSSQSPKVVAALQSSSKPIPSLGKTTIQLSINGMQVNALIDSGSSESYIHPDVAKELNLPVKS